MFSNRCRLAASAIAPISYIALVSGLVPLGSALNLVGQVLIFPFALKHRAWDMIALTVFFTGVNSLTLAPYAAKLAGPAFATPGTVERPCYPMSSANKLAGVRYRP